MSRLIVKNLPNSITTEKLCEIFSEKGLVTDVQLKYTKDGKFRHFGFIGYKSEEEAQIAVKYFNNTCIKTSRIKVEVCAGLGDPSKPKAWSKYAPDSSAFKKEHKENEIEKSEEKEKSRKKKKNNIVQEALEKHKDDPLFIEFMETHTKGQKGVWSNDAVLDNGKVNSESVLRDDMKDRDLGHESDEALSSENDNEEEESPPDNVATEKISDLEYLKMKTVKKDVDSESGEEEDNDDETTKKEKSKIKVKTKKPYVEFFTVKVKGIAYKAKKKDIKQFFHPLKPKSIRISQKIKGIAYVGFASLKEMNKALIKHLSFLAGRRLWVSRYEQKVTTLGKVDDGYSSKWKDQEENLKNEETIAESGRIFVRNLAYTVTEDDIEKLFSEYGSVTEVVMPVDRYTRKIKGYAVVTYLIPENAARAYMELDGTVFNGRMLHILPGKAKLTLEEMMEKEGLTFKQKQLLKKKAEAASSHNWNTLFLGQNAVADLIADTYNTTKEKLLDSSGNESVAVRLALGETQIITKMRDFLEENGVHLDAFNQAPKQRSKTVILAKNLPAKTTVAEITEMFAKFGELGRIVLPPSGITAIVEFLEPSEAKTAFTKLAYTKFKHLPLYLEWAPSDTFATPPSKAKSDGRRPENKEGNDSGENVDGEDEKNASESSEDENEIPEPDSTLFIKNLNFGTDKEAVEEHFKKCGPIHEIIVAKKKDPKNPGQLLSMGYGFIQFKKSTNANTALKTLQHSMLEGHAIELKRSSRTSSTEVLSARKKTKIGKQTGTKILVRNIPFQATRKEVQELFKTFGELKALRLPKKLVGTGSHRGFAFVDFYTKHDAKRAFKALCQSTHLYGRRLVLEWATTEDSIEDIRKRTAEEYSTGPPSKTQKKATFKHDVIEEGSD